MKKINKNKLFILGITIFTLVLLGLFLKNIIVEIIQLEIKGDHDGVAHLLDGQGIFGYISVVLVEGFQMVVVFISAEFIQISAGMSYPWYISVPLCSAGIFLGATIIYLLCNMTKFDSDVFKGSARKLEAFTKKSNNVQLIMYILFVSPIIPFGAICYYGSRTKISYKRYIFTCVTGTIPSIVTSIFLGRIITFTITNNIPIWVLLVSIAGVMILLLTASGFILSKTMFKGTHKTPNSPLYGFFYRIFRFLVRRKIKYNIDDLDNYNIQAPYILLTNHPSGYDMFYAADLADPDHMAMVVNYYYYKNRVIRWLLNAFGVIPKKLFTPDMKTIKKVLKSVKDGHSIYMCPEGRLGLDGTNYYITSETGKFVKQLKQPIIIATIKGAYISKPKWRKSRYKSKVEVKVNRIITKEEVMELTGEEINDIINESISYNEFDYIKEKGLKFKQKNKAEGLENVLYYCPKCHKEFTLSTSGNTIKCDHCGFELEIKEDYHFNDNEFNITNIHDWYELTKEYERENIRNGINLSCDVVVKKFNIEDKKQNEEGTGTCSLTNQAFTYKGDLKVQQFCHDIVTLRALAFSCGEEFECYYNNELYYFYPKLNKKQCVKWALIVDELVEGAEFNEQQ